MGFKVRGDRHEHLQVGPLRLGDNGAAEREGLHPPAQGPPHGGEEAEATGTGRPESTSATPASSAR